MKGQARACSFGVSGGRHAVQLFFLAPWAMFHGAHSAFTAESTKRSTSRTAPGPHVHTLSGSVHRRCRCSAFALADALADMGKQVCEESRYVFSTSQVYEGLLDLFPRLEGHSSGLNNRRSDLPCAICFYWR